MWLAEVRAQVERACRRALSEQNRDPHAPAHGCFDRRFWGWKLVDFPEATFQRNVLLPAWLLRHAPPAGGAERAVLAASVRSGLAFAASVQHADGSWDQAFPHEHSFGAAAFLLHPLLAGYLAVRDECGAAFRQGVEAALRRAADFLTAHGEEHGHIANHLAGAALSLARAGAFFGDERYGRRADELLASILAHQSPEGWFLEYLGADPGYQTLCVYYLAQLRELRPSAELDAALARAAEFLAWFVHPDGSFGGEYGSRRTGVFYPGGLALLAARGNATAAAIVRAMAASISARRTVTLDGIDVANLAPLSANYLLLLEHGPHIAEAVPPLPREREGAADFTAAGLHVRSTARHYVVVGASNGGVVKVFGRGDGRVLVNDGGYAGEDARGGFVTTQGTGTGRATVNGGEITVDAPFQAVPRALPSPGRFLVLRPVNLTLMRSVGLGNAVKRALVRLLISGGKPAPLSLRRTVRVAAEGVRIDDVLRAEKGTRLRSLECGRPFVAIHMASARYFESADLAAAAFEPRPVDVEALARDGEARASLAV
ncbi:MAG TPA: hypothetical protein VFJ82_13670 [Longimicrobium sp.]|nr:hypothetical protein [Longimicrobium sp.]